MIHKRTIVSLGDLARNYRGSGLIFKNDQAVEARKRKHWLQCRPPWDKLKNYWKCPNRQHRKHLLARRDGSQHYESGRRRPRFSGGIVPY
ncbi:unnamed protein product [Ceratitis capitata]|uniref:(Mediterranean fruit fly) hypothetical protein n=1 Tax=Ceratitis capitata TaxID=7213 RepID=A0A811UTU1_CERCA|nr:unnamed protein product [Ceratitis capitata]